MKRQILTAIALACILLLPIAAQAYSLNFGIYGGSGSISYGAAYNPASPDALVGSDIPVANLKIINDDGSVFTYDILGGRLNFRTGDNTSNSPDYWNFAGGVSSYMTLTGTVVDGNWVLNGTLLNTSNFGSEVLKMGEHFAITGASFHDIKNPDLLLHFGLPDYPYQGDLSLSFFMGAVSGADHNFASTQVGSGEIMNTPVPVPLPASLLFFGPGLFGFFAFRLCRMAMLRI